jgi:hypothetical protein
MGRERIVSDAERRELLELYSDVRVADGDGVIVVPRDAAREVAAYARAEHRRDMAGRRKLYDELGMAPDGTVAGT